MQPTRFDAQVRHRDAIAVLDLSGQIDRNAETGLNAAFDGALASSPTLVVLNFDAVDYINSTGIALVVGLLGRARVHGVEMAACGLSDHYREIFEITRLSDFMPLYTDEADAVGGVAAPSA